MFFRAFLIGGLVIGAIYARLPFREYPGVEYERFPLPRDYLEPTEWAFARLMYPPVSPYYGGFQFFGDWRLGGSNWTMDYPRSDRHFAAAIRRLTRLHARSVEQPVNLDDGDDVDHWPFLMAGLAGYWELTDSQVATLREYLLRGGFLFCDSFFGSDSWAGFTAGMRRVFPDRQIVDLPDDHPVFHIVYDLKQMSRQQIPNMNSLAAGGGGWLGDGSVPRWRGIFNDEGRLMVLIAFNNDVADSWQWADNPNYPADRATLGLQIGVNVAVYSMTH